MLRNSTCSIDVPALSLKLRNLDSSFAGADCLMLLLELWSRNRFMG